MKKIVYGFLALAVLAIPVVVWATSETQVPNALSRTVNNSIAVGVGGSAAGTDTINGVDDENRNMIYRERVIIYNTTTTAKTLYSTETGTIFVQRDSSNDPVTFNLPPAQIGLTFIFIDNDATAAADLVIEPRDADQINNQTAGVSYNATGDAYGEVACITAINSTEWVVKYKVGTWSQGS